MKLFRSKLVRIPLLLVASGLLAVLAAEGVLRAFPSLLPERARLRMHWRELLAGETLSIADPEIGFLYPPDASATTERDDLSFTWHTDERGFRNPVWPERADVVAIGDSLVFSYGVDDELAWPRLLDEALGDEVSVANLGLIGACPEQAFRVWKRFGAPLQPKLLLVGVFPTNDVYDTRMFEAWLAAGALGNYDVWRFLRGDRTGWKAKLRGLLDKSALATLLVERQKSNPEYPSVTHTLPGGEVIQLVPGILAESSRGVQPGNPDFERMLASLVATRDDARGRGVEVLFVLFPSKEEVYLPVLGKPTPTPTEAVRRALEQRACEVLDLTPTLQERARAGEALYFEVDGHPNAAGHHRIAERVRAALR